MDDAYTFSLCAQSNDMYHAYTFSLCAQSNEMDHYYTLTLCAQSNEMDHSYTFSLCAQSNEMDHAARGADFLWRHLPPDRLLYEGSEVTDLRFRTSLKDSGVLPCLLVNMGSALTIAKVILANTGFM